MNGMSSTNLQIIIYLPTERICFGFVNVSLGFDKLRMYSAGLRESSHELKRPLRVIVQASKGLRKAPELF